MSYFSRLNRQFHNPRLLQPGNPLGLRLMTGPSTIHTHEIGAPPSASYILPCSPSPRPDNHETSILRLVPTFPTVVSLVFIQRRLDRESLLVRAARASISDYDGGCRIYYGMFPCEAMCHEANGSYRRRGPTKRSTRMYGVW